MIYKNIDVHNAATLIDLGDGVTWKRFPEDACRTLEKDAKQRICADATGVELRFIIKGDEARITLQSLDTPENGTLCTFHVYYGAIQGGWSDHEIHRLIGTEPTEFVFRKHPEGERLKKISTDLGYAFDSEVVRIIFNRGHIKIMDVAGDVEPPKCTQVPTRVMLNYGSSITHGSNSIDMSHSWASVTAHMLNMDCRNLGMAGSCAIEPAVIDYIADEGVKGNWDIATLELGVNVLEWEENKIYERVTYAIEHIASKNPLKPIIVISPFYCDDDFDGKGRANNWRRIIGEIVCGLNFSNVFYKSGLEFIDNISYISADLVHPNIYGVQKIADTLTEYIKTITL